MLNTFIKISINDSIIYVKVSNIIINTLFDILHDRGYKVKTSTYSEWNNKIETGLSYDINTEEELQEFIENNNKANIIKNET